MNNFIHTSQPTHQSILTTKIPQAPLLSTRQKFKTMLTVLSMGLIASAHAADYSQDASVYQFLEAERQSKNPSAMYQYEQSMKGSLFAMYPTYWRLDADLSAQSPNTIKNFVRQYPNHVISEKLVADYAEEKARQSDYASVRAVADDIQNADDSESCAVALGYNAIHDQRALLEKENVWTNTQIKKSLCDKLAGEMIYHTQITRTDKHEQLIRMMRIDRRQLSSRQSPVDKQAQIVTLANHLGIAISSSTLRNIRSNPSAFFAQFASQPFNETNQYLYVYAISQLAHRSYGEAAAQLTYDINQDNARSQKLLSDMARRYAWRSIAVKRMNMNTDDGFSIDAVTYFKNSLGEPFNFEEAEDYAQASIYFSQWQDLERAISAMSPKVRSEPTWQYWLARSYEQQGRQSDAHRLYQAIATRLDYYGILAKDRLGQKLTLQDIGGNQLPALNQNDLGKVMQNPNFARAVKLMENQAPAIHIQREWNWAVREALKQGNHGLILAAARRAHDLGYHDRVIQAFDIASNLRNGALAYPTPYAQNYQRHSRSVSIDPAWALGITRQESRFVTNARSSANATGLMQIIPGTANQIARGLGESTGNMGNPDTNIRYGTWFLSDLQRKTGNIAVATAGYNAGPNAAIKWLPKQGSMSADQFVEAIPYGETRDYVKNVMANTAVYSVLLGNPVSITQRMGTVSPRW